jgi:aminopeptidase N
MRLITLLLLAGCGGPLAGTVRPAVWPLRADTDLANGGDRTCDLVHLELDLRLDYDAQRVSGSATSWIRALPGGVQRVLLHAVGLEVHEVRDGRGRVLEHSLDEPELEILLAEPLLAGEELALHVVYTTRAPELGMVFTDSDPDGFSPQVWTQGQFEDNRYWMPVWDLPNDRATVDLSLRVGHDMRAIANGELVEVVEHGGGERTFRWRQAQRIPTYLVAFAAGRWETYADTAGETPLHYHVPPGTGEAAARAAFHETPAMLTFFEELLDEPYPYVKYDQAVVSDFPWAGMENASITILHDELLGGADALLDLDGDPRLLVAHELAHQWFGDLVTCLGWSHLWLNEAWASYLELVWEREQAGVGSYALWLERYGERYLARGAGCRVPMALDWYTQGVSDERAHHVYTKGPWVLHMLARELGEEAFWAATRAYLDRHADGLVTTADFARAVFDTTGRNVEGHLEQWVLLAGHPELEVRLVHGQDGAGNSVVDVVVRQTQDFGATVPLFDVLVELEVVRRGGERSRIEIPLSEVEATRRVLSGQELVDLIVDPEGDLLAVLDLDKPQAMWLRQVGRVDLPVAQWRAIPHVSRAAAEGAPAAVEALMRLAGESPEPLLRERAAAELGLEDPRAARTLLRLVATDSAARVRHQAAATLLDLVAAGRALRGDELSILQQRLGLERSPETRASLEALLESGS